MIGFAFAVLCLLLVFASLANAWSPTVSSRKTSSWANHPQLASLNDWRRQPHRTTTVLLHSTAFENNHPVQYALYQEQQRSLARKAKDEMDLMRAGVGGEIPDLESSDEILDNKMDSASLQERIAELRNKLQTETKQKRKASGGKGFGGTTSADKTKEKKNLPALSKKALEVGLAQAAVLYETGVVRINGALSRDQAATLRAAVLNERSDAEAAVAAGMASSMRFGDLLLSENRRDVLLPLADSPHAPAVVAALQELFGKRGTLRALYEIIVGEESVMYELASLVSEPGACQQTVHSDMPYQDECSLYTGFMALQDIEVEMGPTTFLPYTHTLEAHEQLHDAAQKQQFLSMAQPRLALLKAGDIAIFDSRGMHCGGWNHDELGSTRALFYFSFTNPKVGKFESGVNMASIRPGYAANPLTYGQLCRALATTSNRPFEDRGDGLGVEGQELAEQREAYRRQRNVPAGSL